MFKSYADEFDASDKTLSIQQQLSGMSNAIIKLLSFADDLRQDNDRKDEQIQKLEMRVTDLESYIRRMDCSLTQSSVGQKDSFTERKYLDMSESEGGSDSSIEEYLNTDQTQIDANEKKPTCTDNIITVELDKMNYSFGIKIVGVNQGPKRKGIYVKAILPDGPAELDGRLQPGDGILEVNGISVKDLSQNEFVQILRGTSHVTLKVERDAAELYHEKKNFQSLRDQPNCAPQASAEAKETVEKCTKCNGTGKRTGLLPLTGFPMLTPIAVTCKDCEGQGIIRKTTISEGKTEHHTEVSFKATPPSYDDVVQK